MGQDEGEEATPSSPIHHAGPTLLSAPLANVVSLVTRSSSLYLRLGTFIGGLALDGARVTTLTGLEISRAIIESVLYRAGKDVSARATGELGRAEAEGLLEKSLATLHKTITSISFAASTGFYISAAALESAKDISQQLLVTLDSVLGSTDSSRAIASIITLIRREFQNPATGHQGEQVGVSDLLIGISGLALLQRWSKKLTDSEAERIGCEVVVWDVVVLDDGRRADVVGTGDGELDSGSLTAPAGQEVARTVQESVPGEDPESGDDMLEMNLKQRIMQALPPQASVSITTSTKTTKTITVEFTGAQPPKLSPPRGVEIVEEDAHLVGAFDSEGEISTDEESAGPQVPRYRIVYRIIRKNLRGTNIQSNGPLEPAEETLDSDTDMANHLSLEQPSKSEEYSSPPVLAAQKSSATSHNNVSKSSRNISKVEKSHGYSVTPGQKDNTANQKRQRIPIESTAAVDGSHNLPKRPSGTRSPTAKRPKPDKPQIRSNERVGSIRNALKKGSAATLSNLWTKDHSPEVAKTTQARPPWGVSATASGTKPQLPTPQRNPAVLPVRDAPRPPQRGNPNYFTSRDLGHMQNSPDVPRSPSRASYYSIHERRRDSIVSQTDTYSIHSTEARPVSPALFRTSLQAQRNLIRARSDKNIVNQVPQTANNHRRTKSEAPSIYTLRTNNSGTSLVLSSQSKRSAFEDSHTFERLMRTGHVEGLFPQHHLVRNITRFVRFASASYGANFLRVMGLATSSIHDPSSTKEVDTLHHHEHHSFSSHTQLPPDTILLSSFVDPEGGTDSTGHTGTGVPMVHFVTLDHDSEAVVLTCRGTLGFEDVLTDMTCDYDELEYNGASYKVHMGIHASARRLLSSRVFFTIKAALEEFPDYGLVLCGHSLGGGVTALLAIMISESSPNGTSFVTSSSQSYTQPRLLESASKLPSNAARKQQSTLPPGRPIHVYAYGPPATISPSLRLATRGLITTIVNGQDLVPHLSLGILHDLQAVALAFKTDDSGAKGEVRKRVWEGLRGTVQDKWYQNGFGSTPQKEEDDEWAHSALKTLRASMLSAKLLPPGEVFVIESVPVLRRDAFAQTSEGIKAAGAAGAALGRPATRSVLRYVRDVEGRFSELRFGGSMLLDHNPGRYEASLGALRRGVLGS